MAFSFSAKIILGKAKKTGNCPLYLQVIINRKPIPIYLGITWPPNAFDIEKGACKKRFAGDHEAADNNKLIKKKLGKAAEVAGDWRWKGQALTKETFLLAFNSEASDDDFIKYFEEKMLARHRKKQISANTKKTNTDTLNKLRECFGSMPFFRLTYEFPEDFNSWMRKNIKARNGEEPSQNTLWGHHKNVKTYLDFARKDKISFEDPYQDFQNRTAESTWQSLTPEQLQALEAYYETTEKNSKVRRVLQKFLFSCHSSLRLSDLKAIDKGELVDGVLTYKPMKTFKKKGSTHQLPLSKKALRYLTDAQEEEGLPGFFNFSDQDGNKVLKAVGKELKIPAEAMHWHVGRETFATESVRKGMPIEILQKMMDHTKIDITMKYVTIHEERKRQAIADIDRFNETEENKKSPLV